MPKEILLYDKPPLEKVKKTKKNKDKKKKPKQKQKQKQTVKQNVEVKVQSSGGSSGGGGGFIPSPFQDRTGENVRIQNLIDTIQRQQQKSTQPEPKAPRPTVPEPTPAPRAPRPTAPDIFPGSFNIPGFTPQPPINIRFEEPGPSTRVERIPDTSMLSLYNRINSNNNQVNDDINNLEQANVDLENAVLAGSLDDAFSAAKEIDYLDDDINNRNDANRDLIGAAAGPARRIRRTPEQIDRDNTELERKKREKQLEREFMREQKRQLKGSKSAEI